VAGKVPVRFDVPVSVVDYRSGEGPLKVVRLNRPSTTAELSVPAGSRAGSLVVAGAPLSWERVPVPSRSLSWFVAPARAGTLALADPPRGATTASSNGPIRFTFDEPVGKVLGASRPTVIPSVPGAWSEPRTNVLVFTPTGFGFGPDTSVTVRFPHPVSFIGPTVGAPGSAGRGARAPVAMTGAMTTATTYHFSVRPGSVLRLEEILAQLHYLPLRFVPADVATPTTFSAELATMSQPLPGSFTWRWASTPSTLKAQWVQGAPNVLLKGALMAFIANTGTYDGYQLDDESVQQIANAPTWKALLEAAAASRLDPTPYSYVDVTQSLPEKLTLWQNGSVVLTSPANTGIPQSPTANGTYPIYARFTYNYMSGHNPNGSYYHDLVHWINYFNGGDAVHGFVRASYGFPQSLGCVELPIPTAKRVFSHLAIGDLVAVAA
jgi:lipoprotein-anchoring transpeptidase ErfK/SrfK